jgi:hypothetical protein
MMQAPLGQPPPPYVVPSQSEHTLRAPATPLADDHGIIHTVTHDEKGVCCPRTAVIPVDPATGVGTLHIDAATLLKTVGTAHPDIHNMTGLKVQASESNGMSGPSGVTFAWGSGANQVPMDTTTRQASHTPDRTDLWHHLAHESSSKMTSEPIQHDLLSGFATPEDMSIAAATMAWDKKLPLEHHADVTDIHDTHKMFPTGKDSTLAAMVLNKNASNPMFLNGTYKPQDIEHPETKAAMTVVTNDEYNKAVKLAADARAPKHMLGKTGGITITTRKIHDSIKATSKNPIVTVKFSTTHGDVMANNKGLQLSAGQVKSVVSGTGQADGPAKPEVQPVMSREDLAAHVGRLLNLGVAAG